VLLPTLSDVTAYRLHAELRNVGYSPQGSTNILQPMTNAEPKSLSGNTAEFLRYLVRNPTQTLAIISDSISCVVLLMIMDTLKKEA
jgi:hypothetical protein